MSARSIRGTAVDFCKKFGYGHEVRGKESGHEFSGWNLDMVAKHDIQVRGAGQWIRVWILARLRGTGQACGYSIRVKVPGRAGSS